MLGCHISRAVSGGKIDVFASGMNWSNLVMMFHQSTSVTSIVQILLVTIILWNRQAIYLWIKGVKLPPGPPRRPITKNLHQLPRTYPWLTYSKWAKQYGSVLSFEVFNKTTIVLNSAKAVNDLLESKASNYSDRPIRMMGGELAGRKKTIFFMSSQASEFKEYRRLLQSGLNPRASKTYRPIQTQEVQVLLRGLLDAPQDFISHIRRNAVAVILKVAYGYQVAGNDDPLVVALEDGMKQLGVLNIPGKYWVEYFPILRFVPEWFPGAGFKHLARVIGESMSRLEDQPLEWAKKQIAGGNYVDSFTSKYLRQEDGHLVTDDRLNEWIKWTAEGLYVGGGDTTVSAMTSFFYAMVTNPHVQTRAQAEIDMVASGRLPTLDDLPALPYITALIKEVLRWAPVAPLGLPHSTVEDSYYEGYYIPKGATIIYNVWGLTHDEEKYPNPDVFNPERHLGPKPQPDPLKIVFGFGRRSCPGAHFAEMALFLNIASILSVFDLLKPLNKDGKEEDPALEWVSGLTLHVKPFNCRIKPRSLDHLLYLEKN
ncbi:cytochrome P450 [Panaeolus papilionaceus]|nr:cytochrome P450 [Panaeolus papilionaceus]